MTKDSYPITKMFEDWRVVMVNVAKKSEKLKDQRGKELMQLFLRRLRMAFIAFHAPIRCKWWQNKEIELSAIKDGKRQIWKQKLLDEDYEMYGMAIARMLAIHVWFDIEFFYRGKREDGIRKILVDKMGKIPPAVDTLRLLKNCYHNGGIHTGRRDDEKVTHVVRGWRFNFRRGKPIPNYHLPAILQLVDKAASEIFADINRRGPPHGG